MRDFINHSRQAKITIELDDYKITMNGDLEPPLSIERSDPAEYLYDDYNYDFGKPSGITISDTTVTLKLTKAKSIKIEKVKWEIPLSMKPRIEND